MSYSKTKRLLLNTV